MTTIEMVNHASLLISDGNVRLLCDPWIEGAAFDNGWDLLAPSRFGYDRFAGVTHIWFSHEHPDHFCPPNLNKIPPDVRARITVLYQRSADRKVYEYCRKLGFGAVLELGSGERCALDHDFTVVCEPHDNGDSWLAVLTPGFRFLNLNDCVVTSEAECHAIARKIGHIDALATQFSYANWVGNVGDRRAMEAAAREKLDWLRTQVRFLLPKYVIPFASFVYFSHEDNYYLNEGMNDIADVVDFVRATTGAAPIALYPGDVWDPAARHDPASALARYSADYERIRREGSRHKSRSVPIDKLVEHGAAFARRLKAKNGPLVEVLPAATVFLEDQQQAVTISGRGVLPCARDREHADLACKSDALDYTLVMEWGGRTLDINGRFQKTRHGGYWKFKIYATLASFNNRGEGFGEIFGTVRKRMLKKLVTGPARAPTFSSRDAR